MNKKKKKWIVIIIAVVLVLAVFGHSKEEMAPAENGSETAETQVIEKAEPDQPVATDSDEEAAEEEASDVDSGLISPEFKKTMDDYEAWFNHYCDVLEKYEENPSDFELLSEMTDLLAEEEEMIEQMEEMDQSEMSNAELAYYIDETARIEKRLLEVAS